MSPTWIIQKWCLHKINQRHLTERFQTVGACPRYMDGCWVSTPSQKQSSYNIPNMTQSNILPFTWYIYCLKLILCFQLSKNIFGIKLSTFKYLVNWYASFLDMDIHVDNNIVEIVLISVFSKIVAWTMEYSHSLICYFLL